MKGIMGALEKVGLVENDAPEVHPAPVAPAAPFALAPAAPITTTTITPGYPATLTAEDQKHLKDIEAQVYATPSSYVIFNRVRATLGNTMDLRTVFSVLVAANPGVTPAKVMADIDVHLGIIESKRLELTGRINQAKAERIDQPTAEIAELVKQNEAALAQIAVRTTRISELQKTVQDANASIADGVARFKLIEDQLNAPLLQTKQLLSSLG